MDDTRGTARCSEPPPKKPRPRSFWPANQGFYNLFLGVVTAVGIVAIVLQRKGKSDRR